VLLPPTLLESFGLADPHGRDGIRCFSRRRGAERRILVGSAYALTRIGLGIIFGAMRVVNFAQGIFWCSACMPASTFGVLHVLGPAAGPVVAAFLAGPIVFAFGWIVYRFAVARVTGAGPFTN
jgi:branched-subunit amino acid ABC-type transport system permease component